MLAYEIRECRPAFEVDIIPVVLGRIGRGSLVLKQQTERGLEESIHQKQIIMATLREIIIKAVHYYSAQDHPDHWVWSFY